MTSRQEDYGTNKQIKTRETDAAWHETDYSG